MAALIFWRPFQDSLSRRHGGATGVLFRAFLTRGCLTLVVIGATNAIEALL